MVMFLKNSVIIRCLKCKYHVRNYCNRNMMKLHERGMLADIFPNNSAQDVTDLCNKTTQCVYAGFDPTARSLHIGNLLVLANLLHWQRSGHQVIALVTHAPIGGATAKVGDPSGRRKEREEQKDSVIDENVKHITQLVEHIFRNHEKYFWKEDKLKPVLILNNSKWYKEMNAIDFICKIGRKFRMGTMLSRSSVISRLESESGMSFTEFSYQIFQAYDWLYLFQKYDCRFQIGGNDQMGNIMSGHDVISKTVDKPVYGLTVPIITTDAGDKYGKSVHNAVWLDPEMTTPFDFYQFVIRTTDADVEKLLKYFTFSTSGEVEHMVKKHMLNPEKRSAQIYLAEQITKLVHGEEGLATALRTTNAMYSSNLETLSQLSEKELENVFKGATLVQMLLQPGITIKQLAMSSKCFIESNADRIITAGGFYINNARTKNPHEVLIPGLHILPNNVSLLRVGKRNYWIVKWLS